MTIRTSFDGRRLAWTLAAASVVTTVLGQLLPWGVLSRGRSVPWRLRMVLIITGVLVLAWAVLRAALVREDVSRRSLLVGGRGGRRRRARQRGLGGRVPARVVVVRARQLARGVRAVGRR